VLPLLTKQFRQGNIKEAFFTQNRAAEFSLLLTLPAATALIIYSEFFVGLIYGYGKFNANPNNVIQTGYTLSAFALGLPAYVLTKVFSSSFFSNKDTSTHVVIGIISAAVNLSLNLYLMQHYQHVGIALGTAVAAWVNTALLATVLYKRKMIAFDKQILVHLPKILLSCVIMGAMIYCIQPYFALYIAGGSFFKKTITMVSLVSFGGIIFLIAAYFLKCVDLRSMKYFWTKQR
jgi:putative peptidoglycan lipid II flippase